MSKIVFIQAPDLTYDCDFKKIGKNRVRLVFNDKKPSNDILLSGFNIVNEHNNCVQTRCEDYIYLYKNYEDSHIIELCNDNSIWGDDKKVITFTCDFGGELEGNCIQKVNSYDELTIPTINTEEGYAFVRWNPEFSLEGKIEKNETYNAVIADKNVYFHSDANGNLDGITKQFVMDYSELDIPIPIANDDYRFAYWSPSIPESGTIDIDNNHFYAVFKSNIPDRLNTVEDDTTSTQLALTEIFEMALANSQQLTDVQLALAEIYEQTLALVNK